MSIYVSSNELFDTPRCNISWYDIHHISTDEQELHRSKHMVLRRSLMQPLKQFVSISFRSIDSAVKSWVI